MKKRGFLDMPFGWIFALLVGAVILFLAIFFVVRLTSTENLEQGIVTSNDVGILLNPLEIGFENAKTTFLKMPSNSRIYTRCDDNGVFGEQKINVSQETFGKISDNGLEASFPNKYIFNENPLGGKDFYIFTKPFNFPYKVSDLVYLIPATEVYCFVNPPEITKKEISDIKIKSVINVSNKSGCPQGSFTVCFSGNCNITVSINQNLVKKNGKNLYFADDSLMYAAIFGDPQQYDCQIKRIAKRTEELASLYDRKQSFISARGCPTDINFDGFMGELNSVQSSQDLSNILVNQEANMIKGLNEQADCQLW